MLSAGKDAVACQRQCVSERKANSFIKVSYIDISLYRDGMDNCICSVKVRIDVTDRDVVSIETSRSRDVPTSRLSLRRFVQAKINRKNPQYRK